MLGNAAGSEPVWCAVEEATAKFDHRLLLARHIAPAAVVVVAYDQARAVRAEGGHVLIAVA